MPGKGLLDQLDSEPDQLGQDLDGILTVPASIRVDADRAVVRGADGFERRDVIHPAELDLQRGEPRGAAGTIGDDRGLVDPEREIGRRDLRREPEQPMDGLTRDLASEVVEGDVERAFRPAVVGDRPGHRRTRTDKTGGRQLRLTDRLEQHRQNRSNRRDGLTVEPIRVALADPDEIRVPIVAQLDDDRRHAVACVVMRPSDPEWIAQRQVEDLVTEPERHSAGRHPRQRLDRSLDLGPEWGRPEPDGVVDG